MIRIIIDYLLPVFLPTLLWVLWLSWRQSLARKKGTTPANWDSVPWTWLLMAGAVLAGLITVGGTLVSGYGTGQYHPARVDETGKLIPGGFD